MSKLNYEDKINLYKDRKNGLTITKLVSKYNIRHGRGNILFEHWNF